MKQVKILVYVAKATRYNVLTNRYESGGFDLAGTFTDCGLADLCINAHTNNGKEVRVVQTF